MAQKNDQNRQKESESFLAEALAYAEDEPQPLRGARDFFAIRLPHSVTKGMLYRDLLRLILPTGVEYGLLQLTGMFDQMQVGSIGEYAVAAVGVASQIKSIFMTLFVAANIGVTASIARVVGEGRDEESSWYLENGIVISGAISAIVTCLGFLLAKPLLRLAGAPDERTLSLGIEYLRICMIGFIPLAFTSTVTAALRGAGNAKASLVYSVTANCINIFLNWLLIQGNWGFPQMGVRGAAIATVTGQIIAGALAFVSCRHSKKGVRFSVSGILRRVQRRYLRVILQIGLPSMLEQIVLRTGIAMFTRVVASLGTVLYAAHTICISIQALTFMTGMSFSVAMTTLAGQSMGKGRQDMAALYAKYCVRISMTVSVLLMAVYYFLGERIIGLYNGDPRIVAAGIEPLRIVAIIQPFTAFLYVFGGALRGVGDTKYVAFVMMITTFVCRPAIAFIAIRVLGVGLKGAWWALSVDQIIGAIFTIAHFVSGKWKITMIEEE